MLELSLIRIYSNAKINSRYLCLDEIHECPERGNTLLRNLVIQPSVMDFSI